MSATHTLVTGASTGIGKALAFEFAKHKHNLVLVARDQSRLEQIKTQTEHLYGIDCQIFAMDLTENAAALKLMESIDNAQIHIEYVVNNAGMGLPGAFISQELKDIQKMLQLNLVVLTELSHIFAQRFSEAGRGGIMNIASVAAFQSIPYMSTYAATKAYVLSLSEAIAGELRPKGVHVTTVCPGPTATEFFDRANISREKIEKMMMTSEQVAASSYKAFKKKHVVHTPGTSNLAMTQLNRFLPRKALTTIMGSLAKNQ